jgi:putative ABC transport system permease protein
MFLARVAVVGLLRAPGRTFVRVLVLTTAVALLGAMLLFTGHALRTMTGGAVRAVPLDWQGPVASEASARQVAAAVGQQPGILEAAATATAPFASAAHTGPAGTVPTGSGAVLAVPPGYLDHLATFRLLQGSLRPGFVVLDQQLAATLQAKVGDTITLTPRRGAAPRSFTIGGVALVTAPDVLFQPLNPFLGPGPAQPPAEIAIMPLDTFAERYAPALQAIAPTNAASAAVPGAQVGVQWQVQARIDPASLGGGGPSQALQRADRLRNRVERTLPGQVLFVDNLSDALTSAAGDALYAQALFIMLSLPGALVALGLAYLAALGTVERDRRELALLRARGASRQRLIVLAGLESLALGLVAGLLGAGIAIGAVAALIKGGVELGVVRVLVTVAACAAIGFTGALGARLAASFGVLRSTVVEGRHGGGRPVRSLWQRLGLDWIALGVSGLIYWLTLRTGFSAVVNPDSNPTLSLSVYMFFAPALLWIGATLLLVRLRGRALAWLAGRAGGDRPTTLSGLLLASASRRGAAINRGLVVVGLLLAFGVDLAVFTATYDQQVRVDAQLTLGADVVASAPPGVAANRNLPARIAAVPGVTATTAVDHSYAYVGPDLQDTYGIDPATFARATSLRDSYFLGAGAGATLARLAARPDGILVSRETITDYSLSLGDLLRLRVLDRATGRFRVAPFHVAGIVQEFPSAPKDSFMVANLSYLERITHGSGPNVVFAKTSGDPTAVAAQVAAATRPAGTIVKNIRQQSAQTVSSITSVDLSGIRRIEETFVVVLAAAAMALFVAVGLNERRHELATMVAVGASLREVAAFLWSEAAIVLAMGLGLAAGLGLLLAEMLVAMLTHVFDPPPDTLAIPWTFLGVLVGAAVVGGLAAIALAARGIGRLQLGAILREQ